MVVGYQQEPRFVVEDGDAQPVDRERQSRDQHVDAVFEQRVLRGLPVDVQRPDVGLGVKAAESAHGGRHDEVGGVADRDAVQVGGDAGAHGGTLHGVQSGAGVREEDLAGRGEAGAVRGAVEQAGPDLLLEAGDLAAEGSRASAFCCRFRSPRPLLWTPTGRPWRAWRARGTAPPG
nr:hypothetical protein [Cryptosporangium phraense]